MQGASRVVCLDERSSKRKVLACNELNFRNGDVGRWPNYYLVVQDFLTPSPFPPHGQPVFREDFVAPAVNKLQ